MRRFEYSRFETCGLHARVVAALAVERGGKADVLGLLGEIVARRAFVPEGFADPRDYCVRALGMSADQAIRRLRAARTAHEFPALLPAIAQGRLGVTAVLTLAPHLTGENCRELIALASGRTIDEVERALRSRLAPTDAPMLERVAEVEMSTPQVATALVPSQAPAPREPAASAAPGAVTEPIFVAPEPVVRRVAISERVSEKLEYAKALLAHATRDEGEVLERALDALIAKLEARRFAKTDRQRPGRCSSNPRYIPAPVRRAVYERDGGRCTFVGDHGHRCETREYLQFGHIVSFAKGGLPTVGNLRLRCRAHNQHEADREFGDAFMRGKREARRARQALPPCRDLGRAKALAPYRESARSKALAPELVAKQNDLLGALHTLGYSARQAKWAAAQCADRLELPLEGLFRHALAYLAPASVRRRSAPLQQPEAAPCGEAAART